jgi:gliding motility-associated-like protein
LRQYLFIVFLILGFGYNGYTQNLVPNHDFSLRKTCLTTGKLSDRLFNWFDAPTYPSDTIYGSTHSVFDSDTCYPNHDFGYDSIFLPGTNCLQNLHFTPFPKEGSGYIAASIVDTFLDTRSWYSGSLCQGNFQLRQNNLLFHPGRGFAQVELNQGLQSSKEYVIEFHVMRVFYQNNIVTNNIGALVTQDTFRHFDYKKQNIVPTIEAKSPIVQNTNWIKVKESFVANGTERFLTLGNFRTDKNSNFQMVPLDTNQGGVVGPQYYFDAVYLYLHTDTLFNVELPPDTTLCPGQTLQLHAWHDDGFKLEDSVKTFLWSTGSTDSSITVTQPGFYWVKVEYNHRFWQSDTIEVKRAVPPYTSGLNPLREGCQGDEVILKAQSDPNRQLVWSTGYVGQSITVKDSGYYWLSALSVCDTVIDSVLVHLIDCDTVKDLPPVYIPSAFTPNGDGLNDTWAIGNLPKENELVIFNRWGELIYRKVNYANEWDGTNRDGSKLPLGIYIYQLTYNHNNGKTIIDQGWVSVLDN